MATIQTGSNTSYYSIQRFLGVNESLDGDTQLQLGEASIMENWRVTPQYHLRIRPGLKTLWKFTGPVRGLWSGDLAGRRRWGWPPSPPAEYTPPPFWPSPFHPTPDIHGR